MNTYILPESSILINFRAPTANPMMSLAVNTGSITATIWQIPNQPFRFWVYYSIT
jgi:hypothetical protein